MRLFIAVDMPEGLKKRAAELQKGLPEEGIKKVTPPHMHFTLKFLGDVSEKGLGKVIEALEKVDFSPFKVTLRGVGVFPSEQYIRVIWVGAKSSGMQALAGKVNDALEGIFLKTEFTPHLTIARVKKKVAVSEFLAEYKNMELGKYEVGEFYLVQSVLGPGGPKYTTLAKFEAKQ